ncbi:MAG: lysine--tRNA ligase, partial [Candidatus Moranbacteria bacterium]|nr:lysine--tRNA ligase [Candidatus Moranbacteria bacterium]
MPESLREERIRKVAVLKEKGINPYPSSLVKKEEIKQILTRKPGQKVKAAGRIMLFREMGKITFIQIQDESGKIQLVLNKNKFSQDYKFWLKNLDLGDFIFVKGERFDTKKGESSILVENLKLLSKAMRPLPSKFGQLKDDDKRQRFRELEMISNREVFEKFKRRSEAIKTIRQFMWKNGFTEVETPILQSVYGGTYAKPFVTHYNALDFDLYLRIAPEMFLKRAITGGFERVFEIGKCFRNEGMDPSHLQEFTMFEFYWAYADYNKLMDFTEKLIDEIIKKVYGGSYCVKLGGNKIDLKPPYPRVSFKEIVKKYLKVDLRQIDNQDKLAKFVKDRALQKELDFSGKVGWAAQIDELYKKKIRPYLIQPVFITDYPKEFVALAKEKEDDKNLVGTFQLVLNTWELLKAY